MDRRSFLKGLSGAALTPAIASAQGEDPLQQLIEQNPDAFPQTPSQPQRP